MAATQVGLGLTGDVVTAAVLLAASSAEQTPSLTFREHLRTMGGAIEE